MAHLAPVTVFPRLDPDDIDAFIAGMVPHAQGDYEPVTGLLPHSTAEPQGRQGATVDVVDRGEGVLADDASEISYPLPVVSDLLGDSLH
jgi:hypothetical protein